MVSRAAVALRWPSCISWAAVGKKFVDLSYRSEFALICALANSNCDSILNKIGSAMSVNLQIHCRFVMRYHSRTSCRLGRSIFNSRAQLAQIRISCLESAILGSRFSRPSIRIWIHISECENSAVPPTRVLENGASNGNCEDKKGRTSVLANASCVSFASVFQNFLWEANPWGWKCKIADIYFACSLGA